MFEKIFVCSAMVSETIISLHKNPQATDDTIKEIQDDWDFLELLKQLGDYLIGLNSVQYVRHPAKQVSTSCVDVSVPVSPRGGARQRT